MMSQHFSSIQQNLFKTLEADIFKFKQHGPPAFQLNIPCKYKEQCKYGRYSCNYSHNSFCKFQKKGKKCLNVHCTHNHELPLEYQLAQAFLTMEMQCPSDFSSFEAQISASECHFSSNSSSKNGTSVQPVFRFERNNSPVNSYDKNPINNNINSFQHQNKAETQFTAFSPLFQHSQKMDKKFTSNQPFLSSKCAKINKNLRNSTKSGASISSPSSANYRFKQASPPGKPTPKSPIPTSN